VLANYQGNKNDCKCFFEFSPFFSRNYFLKNKALFHFWLFLEKYFSAGIEGALNAEICIYNS
jgi:hypothetical protein